MTGQIIQPTLQKPNPPTLEEVLFAKEREILKLVNCARPGTIVSFDSGTPTIGPTCSVQIAQNQVAAIAPDGTRTIQAYSVIEKVPVWFLGGGNIICTCPIKKGDECLIIFNDREIDGWLQSGAGTTPVTDRLHAVTDCFVLVGLHSNINGIINFSNDSFQLRTLDGGAFVELGEDGHVTVLTPGVLDAKANSVTVEAETVDVTATTTTIHGNLVVTGTIEADGNIIGNGINLDTHRHSGVQTGSGDTGGPIV